MTVSRRMPTGRPRSAACRPMRSVGLARRAAGRRTLITCSQSLQRAEHGEQPVWMGVVLAAMLGQIGLPGGGFAYALGSTSNTGKPPLAVPLPTLPIERNSIADFIPVARIADMLLHPGEPFDFNGQRLTYPDIKLVYWAGGNPFHHHQDLNRLRDAFARPDTVIVHDSAWTASARHADIVLPATVTLEREDIGGSPGDPLLVAMHRAVPALCRGARRLRHLFCAWPSASALPSASPRAGRRASGCGISTSRPAARCWSAGRRRPISTSSGKPANWHCRPWPGTAGSCGAFRRDPDAAPLPTPSGKIEIASAKIAGFGYADCPGTPGLAAAGREGPNSRFPLQLIANQPATRLHSQLDFGATSLKSKIKDREPVRIHPQDAAARGIGDGDIVRLYNDRGACLAGAVLSEALRPGVVQLSTGAWYDPEDPAADKPLCVHGNPNVLTRDAGTSKLAQGCTGQLAVIEIERFDGPLPPVKAFDPPSELSAENSQAIRRELITPQFLLPRPRLRQALMPWNLLALGDNGARNRPTRLTSSWPGLSARLSIGGTAALRRSIHDQGSPWPGLTMMPAIARRDCAST